MYIQFIYMYLYPIKKLIEFTSKNKEKNIK